MAITYVIEDVPSCTAAAARFWVATGVYLVFHAFRRIQFPADWRTRLGMVACGAQSAFFGFIDRRGHDVRAIAEKLEAVDTHFVHFPDPLPRLGGLEEGFLTSLRLVDPSNNSSRVHLPSRTYTVCHLQ